MIEMMGLGEGPDKPERITVYEEHLHNLSPLLVDFEEEEKNVSCCKKMNLYIPPKDADVEMMKEISNWYRKTW